MALLRIGQMLPAEHDFIVEDAVQGEKMVYQLLRDTKQNVSYVAWNAQIMGIAAATAMFAPYMEEKRLHTDVARSVNSFS